MLEIPPNRIKTACVHPIGEPCIPGILDKMVGGYNPYARRVRRKPGASQCTITDAASAGGYLVGESPFKRYSSGAPITSTAACEAACATWTSGTCTYFLYGGQKGCWVYSGVTTKFRTMAGFVSYGVCDGSVDDASTFGAWKVKTEVIPPNGVNETGNASAYEENVDWLKNISKMVATVTSDEDFGKKLSNASGVGKVAGVAVTEQFGDTAAAPEVTTLAGEVENVELGFVLEEVVIVKLPPKTINFNYPCYETHLAGEEETFSEELRGSLLNLLGEGVVDDENNVHYLTYSNVTLACTSSKHVVTVMLGTGDEKGIAPFEDLLVKVIKKGKFQLPDSDLPTGFTECEFSEKPKAIATIECDKRTTTTSTTSSTSTATSTSSTKPSTITSTSTTTSSTTTQRCPPIDQAIFYHGEIIVAFGHKKAPDRKKGWSSEECAHKCLDTDGCQYWLISKQRGCVLKKEPDGRVEESTDFNTFLAHGNVFPLCYVITTSTQTTTTTQIPKFRPPECKSTGHGKAFAGPIIASFTAFKDGAKELTDMSTPRFEAACMAECAKDIRCGYWLVHKKKGCKLKAKKVRSALSSPSVLKHGVCLYKTLHDDCVQTHVKKTYVKYGKPIIGKADPALKLLASKMFFPGPCSNLCAETKGCIHWRINAVKGCQIYKSLRDNTIRDASKVIMGSCVRPDAE